mgnify:CR=1 FL=1
MESRVAAGARSAKAPTIPCASLTSSSAGGPARAQAGEPPALLQPTGNRGG